MGLKDENVVRARIGLGLTEDVTGLRSITIMGMTVYGYTKDGHNIVGADKFGTTVDISDPSDTNVNSLILTESMKFLGEFFTKFEDPLALATLSNTAAREIMTGVVDPTGSATIMDVIRAGGPAGYIVKHNREGF